MQGMGLIGWPNQTSDSWMIRHFKFLNRSEHILRWVIIKPTNIIPNKIYFTPCKFKLFRINNDTISSTEHQVIECLIKSIFYTTVVKHCIIEHLFLTRDILNYIIISPGICIIGGNMPLWCSKVLISTKFFLKSFNLAY